MKSLRARLTVWFAFSLVLVLAGFVVSTYRVLDDELHHKNWRRDYPEHPDWKLHGSYSEEEIQDILGELVETSLLRGIPLALIALLIGYWLARKSVQPIAQVNRQLREIGARNLSQRIGSPAMDREFRDLVGRINELLERLEHSFNDVSEYAAKVAHELRTPLAILRLKVEQGGDRIGPELAEDIQAELHQLTHVVDQSLLMAKAEQGRLVLQPGEFDLAEMLADITEDFALLAQEESRSVNLAPLAPAIVLADPKYTRQMIHNLFTNALKHGDGEVRVKLRTVPTVHVLTISNRIGSSRTGQAGTLRLGLRVVDTLLNLQPSLKCRRRRLLHCYAVRLVFPAIKRSEPAPQRARAFVAAIDPGI